MFGVFMCLVQCGDFWCIASVVFGRANYFYSVVVRSTVVWGRVKVALWCEGECIGSRSSSGRVLVRGSGGSAAASAGHCQSLPVSRR